MINEEIQIKPTPNPKVNQWSDIEEMYEWYGLITGSNAISALHPLNRRSMAGFETSYCFSKNGFPPKNQGKLSVTGYEKWPHMVSDLRCIGSFAAKFEFWITLSTDLHAYRAINRYNNENGTCFKDAFTQKTYNDGFKAFCAEYEHLRQRYGNQRKKTTMIFFPHGHEALMKSKNGKELKICATPGKNLKERIFEMTSATLEPLLVSDNLNKHQKLKVIQSSEYLKTALYVPENRFGGQSIVFYGFAFNDSNSHILDALKKNPPSRFAISVYEPHTQGGQDFISRVDRELKKACPDAEILYFDAASDGCWNNPPAKSVPQKLTA